MSWLNKKAMKELADEAKCDRELEQQRERMRKEAKEGAKQMLKDLKRLEKDDQTKFKNGFKRW